MNIYTSWFCELPYIFFIFWILVTICPQFAGFFLIYSTDQFYSCPWSEDGKIVAAAGSTERILLEHSESEKQLLSKTFKS